SGAQAPIRENRGATRNRSAKASAGRRRMPPLSADRWRALSPYLDEALEIPTVDRAAWLASIFARDKGLAVDLQTLLAEHDLLHDSHFLEQALPLTTRTELTQSLEGQIVGAYRLVSLIGQ